MTANRFVHGYTNECHRDHDTVVKKYTKNDAAARMRVEIESLGQIASGDVPVPEVMWVDEPRLQVGLSLMPGRHGQELLDGGAADRVLFAAGAVLRRLHDQFPGFVHGDFGPQNLLLDERQSTVTAVLDWEFAGEGERIRDLAWAEWIVRTHHPHAVAALDHFFDAYGERPNWTVRRAAMQSRCLELVRQCQHWRDPTAVKLWQGRAVIVEHWCE